MNDAFSFGLVIGVWIGGVGIGVILTWCHLEDDRKKK